MFRAVTIRHIVEVVVAQRAVATKAVIATTEQTALTNGPMTSLSQRGKPNPAEQGAMVKSIP
jgi:hypothetical protein